MELWAFLLLGLGLIFILLEVFFPSFGLLGTIAAGCVVAGGVLAYRSEAGIFGVYVGVALLFGPLVAVLGLKVFPKTPMGKFMTLGGSSFDPKEAAAGGGGYDDLQNVTGVAETPLRPAGKAVLNGRRIHVLTRGELIDRGRPVRVVRVEGNRVFVAEMTS